MTQRSTSGNEIVRKTVAGPSISKYDLVAVAIPAAYFLVAGPAVVAGASVRLALVAASVVAAGVMAYALFVDPPAGVDSQSRRSTPARRSAVRDATEEKQTIAGRSDAS